MAPDGTAHVIWNDGAGVSYAVSTDGGRKWTERERIHPQGGSSHLAIGPNGELAVRVTALSASGNQFDEGVEFVAVSTDGGQSWQKKAPPGTPQWDPTFEDPDKIPRWVEPLAWDGGGALYHLWSKGQDLWLGLSTNQGDTWSSWPIARNEDRVYFPYLVARGRGELAASWFSGRGEKIRVHVARILLNPQAVGEAPVVSEAVPFQPEVWTRGKTQTRGTGGEYVPVSFLADGSLAVVTTIQNKREDRWGFSWWRIDVP